jgi:WD40 repeat protein
LLHHSLDKIAASIENISNEQISDPFALFKSPDKIFSLAFHREFLIIGSVGYIHGYSISSSGIIEKKDWSIQLPISPEACEMSEINDLWVDPENDLIYAGCGDANIYVCSLEDGNFVRKLSGHKDYIHSVHGL